MKKILFLVLLCFFLTSHFANAQQGIRFHGFVKNSIYSYQTEKTHTRAYQYVQLNLATPGNNVILSTSMRALSDANEPLTSDQRFKAYTFHLQIKNLLWNRLNMTVGRQFLHPGTILGGLDGAIGNLKILKNLSLMFYAGTESNFQRAFKIYETKDSFVSGGLLQMNRLFSTRLQLLYLQKKNDQGIFWQIAGLNVDNALVPKTRLRLQAHYDMQNQRMHRLLVSARNTWSTKFMTTLEYKIQYPQVYAMSFFTIFQPTAYRQIRANAAFQFVKGYFINAQYQLVQFEEDDANRVFLTIQSRNGSIGAIYESGYAGDQLGLMFDYALEILPNLMASVYVDYSKYRTEQIYEYDNQLSNAARLSYRFNSHWSMDVEYQWLTNRYKEKDARFLNHISCRW